MEQKRIDNNLNILELDLTMYEDKTSITYMLFPTYQVHTVDLMLLCVDTGASHSCIGDKALERIVSHSGCRSIPIIDSTREFRFGDKFVRSRGIVELMLPTSRSTYDIPFILDVVDVKIPPLLE